MKELMRITVRYRETVNYILTQVIIRNKQFTADLLSFLPCYNWEKKNQQFLTWQILIPEQCYQFWNNNMTCVKLYLKNAYLSIATGKATNSSIVKVPSQRNVCI